MENKLSFTKQIKEEICSNLDISEDRKKAILSAFVKNVGLFQIVENSFRLILKTDSSKIAKYIYKLFHDLFNINPKFAYEINKKFKEKTYFVLRINEKVEEILDYLKVDMFNNEIDEIFYSNDEMINGYICGSFLAVGSCNDPSSSNYHLEMAFSEPEVAVSTQNMVNSLNELAFNMRLIKRRNKVVLYLKKSDLISSFLVLIGAVESCLNFENTRVERDFANIDNRMFNLDGANYGKTIATSKKQIEDIKKLDEIIKIENLPNEKLRELCKLRLENEEASLKDLSYMMGQNLGYSVSKSNVSHLFKKIEEMVERYTGKNNE